MDGSLGDGVGGIRGRVMNFQPGVNWLILDCFHYSQGGQAGVENQTHQRLERRGSDTNRSEAGASSVVAVRPGFAGFKGVADTGALRWRVGIAIPLARCVE